MYAKAATVEGTKVTIDGTVKQFPPGEPKVYEQMMKYIVECGCTHVIDSTSGEKFKISYK